MSTSNSKTPDLKAILRHYLREAEESMREQITNTKRGQSVFSGRVAELQDPIDVDLEFASEFSSEAQEALARRDYRSVQRRVDRAMEENGLPEDTRTELAEGILRADIEVYERAERWLVGDYPPISEELEEPATPSHIPLPSQIEESPAGPLLSDLCPRFVDEMVAEGAWKGQTASQNKTTYRLFTQVCGDRPVESYTKRDVGEFRDIIKRLPKHYSKEPRWRGMALREIVDAAGNEAVERLTVKTLKRHTTALSALFRHLREQGYYERDNPATGFRNLKKTEKKTRDQWDDARLLKLFSSPIWSGCHPFYRAQPGPSVTYDACYWLPILGLYTAARLEELAQLHRSDIGKREGIPYIHIHGEGDRQIKSPQSERKVPLHPFLQEAGFMQYVEDIAPRPEARVFPELKPGGPDKKLSAYYTKQFTEYRKRVGVYDERIGFHSLRHTAITRLIEAGVERGHRLRIIGHEREGTEAKHYDHSDLLEELLEEISKLSWPDVEKAIKPYIKGSATPPEERP